MLGRARASLVLGVLGLSGCGGGAPLLHPAHTLPQGEVTFAAGTSGHFSLAGLRSAENALDDAGGKGGGARSSSERTAFAEGALARFAVAPGVTPFVGGRVGLGGHNEAGFSYLGRSLRFDARHAFEWPTVALSLGIAASGALSRAGDQPSRRLSEEGPPDSDLVRVKLTSLRGYGLELPVLFGYRSSADVVKLWAGLRVGVERDSFDIALVESPDVTLASEGEALRLWGGGLVGFSVGLAPIEVRVELDAAYQRVHGSLVTLEGELEGDVAGLSLTPAMAISAKF
jgi:hypothetical protein